MNFRFPWQKADSFTGPFSAASLLAVVGASPTWLIRGDAESRLIGQVIEAAQNPAAIPPPPPSPSSAAPNAPGAEAGKPETAQYRDGYDTADEDEYEITEGGVAIIPVHGVMVDAEPRYWFSYYGLCSTPQITRWLMKAQTDMRVSRVLLHLKTPGGQASGMSALADAAFALRGQKPLVAYCRDACSAGYFLASQADKVYVAADGYTGCIGTLILLTDWSRMFSTEGIIRYRITSTGAEMYKGQGAMGTEVLPEQQADFKRVNDEHQGLFNAAIVRGRGITVEVMATLADGRYHVGQWGVVLGLADAVATESQVLDALNAGQITLLDQGDNPPNDDDPEQSRNPTPTLAPALAPTTTLPAKRSDPAALVTTTIPFQGNFDMNLPNFFRRVADEAEKEAGQQNAGTGTDTAAAPASAPAAQSAPAAATTTAPNPSNPASNTDQAELTRLRGLEDRVLKSAREQATQSAVRAFKDDKPDHLEKVKKSIENCRDLDELELMQTRYESMTPDAYRKTDVPGQRQMDGTEQLATTGDEKEFYDNIRANPTK